jgi:hypothetical protein
VTWGPALERERANYRVRTLGLRLVLVLTLRLGGIRLVLVLMLLLGL